MEEVLTQTKDESVVTDQIQEEVTSPTFVIQKTYKTKNNTFKQLIHIDAFRLDSGKEILKLNFKEELTDPSNLICFEWPDMVSDVDAIPTNSPIIEFEFVDENTREISFFPSLNNEE